MIARTLSVTINDAEQEHVENSDRDVELADRAQEREQPDARHRAEQTAGEQYKGKCKIHCAAAPVVDGAGKRGGRDMAGDAGHRHRGRDPEEDQQRRHQETATDPEHA
jgi:hypothetical protein